ncbi:hypothetical protein GGR57DRAFT_4421 [Xylariaceae sp. FL1272]|nr:hypothetical protein GGR57DRAFT_4421 [Xylariaceae sp. FL1272]
MASASIPTQVAELVQTAHINRSPSPRRDINPATAASGKEPVYISSSSLDDIDDDDEIPVSVLKPTPRGRGRRQSFPPMPDLRFEQSYLHSIAGADSWLKVGWITVRDQMMMPLAQGLLYNLAIIGWQHWNRNAQLSGSSLGARVRRWWYGVNNWPLPEKKTR